MNANELTIAVLFLAEIFVLIYLFDSITELIEAAELNNWREAAFESLISLSLLFLAAYLCKTIIDTCNP